MIRIFPALALALAPVWGQVRPMPVPTTTAASVVKPPAAKTLPAGAGLEVLEKNFDDRLEATGAQLPTGARDAVQLRGFTRALKLTDYGAVFTAEVDLVASPTPFNMFQRSISPEVAKQVHERKLVNLPILQKTMREMIADSAKSLEPAMMPDARIVLAVRLLYQSWEDRTGLPGTILLKGKLSDILAGRIEEEIQ